MEENENMAGQEEMAEKTAAPETGEKVSQDAEQESAPEAADTATNESEAPEEEAPDEEQPEDSAENDGKAGWFGKKRKKELEEKEQKIAELSDQYRRTIAEFDNFRKRSEKEKAARFDMGIRSVAEKILPVVDNFERGLAGLTEEQSAEPFAEGMIKIYRQMADALDSIGIVPIEAVGKPFDPNLHNAVMHVEDETVGENIVVEELQKGYTHNGTVVRYSMVKVAN